MSRKPVMPRPGEPISGDKILERRWYEFFREILRLFRRTLTFDTTEKDDEFSANWDTWYRIDTSGDTVQVNLPPASDYPGGRIGLRCTGGNALDLAPNGTDKIEGSASTFTTRANLYNEVTSDGAGWWITSGG